MLITPETTATAPREDFFISIWNEDGESDVRIALGKSLFLLPVIFCILPFIAFITVKMYGR